MGKKTKKTGWLNFERLCHGCAQRYLSAAQSTPQPGTIHVVKRVLFFLRFFEVSGTGHILFEGEPLCQFRGDYQGFVAKLSRRVDAVAREEYLPDVRPARTNPRPRTSRQQADRHLAAWRQKPAAEALAELCLNEGAGIGEIEIFERVGQFVIVAGGAIATGGVICLVLVHRSHGLYGHKHVEFNFGYEHDLGLAKRHSEMWWAFGFHHATNRQYLTSYEQDLFNLAATINDRAYRVFSAPPPGFAGPPWADNPWGGRRFGTCPQCGIEMKNFGPSRLEKCLKCGGPLRPIDYEKLPKHAGQVLDPVTLKPARGGG